MFVSQSTVSSTSTVCLIFLETNNKFGLKHETITSSRIYYLCMYLFEIILVSTFFQALIPIKNPSLGRDDRV